MVESHFDKFGKDPRSLVYGYMMFYAASWKGDEAMRKRMVEGMAALKGFGVKTGNHAIKDFSANRRGVPLMMWYMTDLAKKPEPWAGQIDLGPRPPNSSACPRIAAPTLDGKAEAGEWDKAALLKLVGDPDPGAKLQAPAELRIGHDGEKLYVLVRAEEPLVEKLRLEVKEDGGAVYGDDCVELYVSPVPRRLGFKLIVNAAGVRATTTRGFEAKSWKAPAPADFPVKAGRWEKGWLLEVVIPFDKLPLKDKPKAGQELGFNCNRFRQVGNRESTTWCGASNQVDSIGTLKLE
jgi:hypothetical protein